MRPYKCIPCDKSFGLLCVLRKHQKSHERKGDATKIVTAPKGRRGCLSYIDFGEEEEEDDEQQEQQQTATVLTSALHPPQAYIPSAPQYVQSTYTITPLSQMQVLHGGAYGEEIVAVLDQGNQSDFVFPFPSYLKSLKM